MSQHTIRDRVYHSIWNDIVQGVYDSNHVFNEKTLVEKYQVSKSPVRDALVELCNEGVLRSIPRFGYEIVKISEKQVREIIDLRVLIECDNLRKICQSLSVEQMRIITEFNKESEIISYTSDTDVIMHWNNNSNFHRTLYSLSNNEFGLSLLERCMKVETLAYSQFYRYTLSANRRMTIDYHKTIVEYMAQGSHDEAVAALKEDIEFIKNFG